MGPEMCIRDSISNINMDVEENSRYISWAVSKLKQELIARGASTRGRKTDLIERYKSTTLVRMKIIDNCVTMYWTSVINIVSSAYEMS